MSNKKLRLWIVPGLARTWARSWASKRRHTRQTTDLRGGAVVGHSVKVDEPLNVGKGPQRQSQVLGLRKLRPQDTQASENFSWLVDFARCVRAKGKKTVELTWEEAPSSGTASKSMNPFTSPSSAT
jgi:hypothetical protein